MALPCFSFVIPTDIRFADLQLAGGPGEALRYQHRVLQRVVQASGLPDSYFQDHPERPWEVIRAWYESHLQDMGAPDPVIHFRLHPLDAAGFGDRHAKA